MLDAVRERWALQGLQPAPTEARLRRFLPSEVARGLSVLLFRRESAMSPSERRGWLAMVVASDV